MPRTATILAGTVLTLGLLTSTVQALDHHRAVVHDIPRDELIRQFGEVGLSQLTRADSIAIASFRFTGDTLKAVVILVDWADRLGTWSPETIDSQMFSSGIYPTGSLNDYYDEVSYGTLAVTGDVFGWYDGGTYSIYYSFESLLPALDESIDFSQYDGNNDGSVDAVFFIRSGNGKEDSQDPNDIWSYAPSYPPGEGPGPFDGMYIDHWLTVPETRPLRNPLNPTQFSGIDTLNRIGPCAHELGHSLGLPDLYDYDNKIDVVTYETPNDGNDHPLVDWCLMGYGGYGVMSIGQVNTRHFCGWSKKQLGWVEPITLDGFIGEIVINDIETHSENSLFLLPIDLSIGEYFLLEYRNPPGDSKFGKTDSDFSVYLWPHLQYGYDPLERGLLITHIHDSLVSFGRINDGLPTFPHYTVAVEDAGYNPGRDAFTNPDGHVTDSAHWWYPYETRKAAPFTSLEPGKELFGPATCPNSDGYYSPTGIFVRVDSLIEDRLYAYVKVPSNDWRVDIESKTVYTGTTDATIAITAYWTMEMAELMIPLVIREIDAGAFWSGTLPVDTAGGTAQGVQWNWSNPGWADAVQEVRPGIPSAPCNDDGDSGYDGVSPDHLVVVARSAGMSSTPPEPNGRDVVTFTFEIGETPGAFEIDTACFAGSIPGIVMVDGQIGDDHGPLGPHGEHFMFNKGTITILQSLNPEIGSTSPEQNALNVAATTDIVVVFADEIDGSTITASTMTVHGGLSGPYDGTILYNETTRTATFDPTYDFRPGEVVTITLTRQILTTGGVQFSTGYAWSFTVETTAGDGIFARVTELHVPVGRAIGVATADIDADGDLDLLVASLPELPPPISLVNVYRNDGSGQFVFDQSYAVGDEPLCVTTADFDADGDLDIVTASYETNDLSFLFNNGDGTFAPMIDHDIPYSPWYITAGDFNRDGYADIALGTTSPPYGNGHLLIKLNRGDGTFPTYVLDYQTMGVGYYPLWLTNSDMDNDGDMDMVFVSTVSNYVAIAPNTGAGFFSRPDTLHLGYGSFPLAAPPADLDHDGDLDLAVVVNVSQTPGYLSVFLNDGQAGLTSFGSYQITDHVGYPVVGDFDHDGDLDIVTLDNVSGLLYYFINNGDGSLTLRSDLVKDIPEALCSGDFNGDGGLDLAYVHSFPGVVSILLNCYCHDFCDLDQDGSINPVDVVMMVNLVFRQLDSREPLSGCPAENGDFNCDGQVNPVDVVWYVNYVYKTSGIGPGDPCACDLFPSDCPGPQ